jgi:hypothetical protein
MAEKSRRARRDAVRSFRTLHREPLVTRRRGRSLKTPTAGGGKRSARRPLSCANIRSYDCSRERIVVMQPAQRRFREHDDAFANAVSGWLGLERDSFRRRIGHAGSKEGHMRARPIVVAHPDFEDGSQVRLGDRNHPVQTLASDCSDQPFADPIGLCRQLHLMVTVQRGDCVLRIPFTPCADVSSRS